MIRRSLIATALIGATTFTVFLVTGTPTPTVQEQAAFLADSGTVAATHVITCPVRFVRPCLADLRDAGFTVHKNDRIKFPVNVTDLADGGREIQLPPMPQYGQRACFFVADWGDCGNLKLASTDLTTAALWGSDFPVATSPAKKCVRAKQPTKPCLRALADGGSYDFGDRNVYPKSEAVDPATCEKVECSILLGDDPEVDL